ncbi:class II fructose-1,6-bisphosphate aldolase [Mycoplasmopsis synoviae]|uniref:Class II fructose-1,6-bisphosphate aldolase n=3 Tax=Mycoplasmopsis TaxID=2767358 RepID=A0AAQ2YNQ9_MYCSY|nr:class II fructose-1,6-bisphosphate aldolase [Mycoplasmopsis synoviae]AKB11432.1 fructose-bisphosphate aldolase [Mycoplasmopsis synoviae ATCC 25204]AKJ20575.1 Fructose-bisphosphate aldolase class II [Mycoplasmopsis synoviae]AQU47895.1 Fructose-bisphosphate aldolase class II [Mycoplasmopsis synoviae]AWL84480.1 fructose-1,6-bisphosphate aldolase, class II [Mycoplasmopsis synoviae]QLE14198.1 fructose-1,6-bisphosphate aldolase, class II [Mycoplasmopsis synoviae]
MPLTNAKEMLIKAKEGRYAVPHININNLEWAKAVLLAAQEVNSPLILATSEGAVKYMGGFKTVANMVKGLVNDLNISIPVALHLDHGSYEGVKKALETDGYSSVMFDGSHYKFAENYEKTKELLELAKTANCSFEAEVGTIGGEEDGIIGSGELADAGEAKQMAELGIDVLAAGIGNVHGPYPENWKSLDFDKLKEIVSSAKIGIVLHGGSGIPQKQIQKAISLGVTKINVNTELQQANHKALREFILSNKDLEGKNFDPRKLYKPGFDAMQKTVKEKIHEFGSQNKA